MIALKVSDSDVGEGGVAVNCEKTQYFLNTLYIPMYIKSLVLPNSPLAGRGGGKVIVVVVPPDHQLPPRRVQISLRLFVLFRLLKTA